MKSCLKVILLVLLPIGSMAQFSHPDSLIQALKLTTSDSARVSIMEGLVDYYAEANRDSAIYYSDEILLLVNKNNKKLEEANCWCYRGYLLMKLGKYPESFSCLQHALNIAEDPESEKNTWYSYSSPRKIRLRVLEYIHHNFGHLMGNTNNTEQQILHYNETLKIAEEIGDTSMLGFVTMNLGSTYLHLGKIDSALLMEKNAELILKQTGEKKYLSYVYYILGNIYLKKGDKDSALQNYHKGIDAAIEQNNIAYEGSIYNSLTNLFLLEKDKDSGLYYAKKYLKILQTMGSTNLGTAYQNLFEGYKLKNEMDSAYKYQGLALISKDSAYNKTIENLTDFQKLYFKEQMRLQELEEEKSLSEAKARNYAFLTGLGVFLFIGFMLYRNNRQQQKANKVLVKKNEIIAESKKRSDELLLNILPIEVAEELKLTGHCQAKTFSMVTIMFADFKDFTSVSEKVSAELLVDEINYCFSAFDLILPKYKVEKIKTVGDAYICVGGMPTLNFTHAPDVISAALEIRNFMLERKKEKETRGEIPFELRIGIHTGPVVAGIVGVKKYAYDIWGDTVNLAARMESSGEAGKINISGVTYTLVKDKFNCTYRGKIVAKNKGEVDMYFVEA